MRTEPVYRTAAELGIREWEREGLIALVGPLSRGELDVNMHAPKTRTKRSYVFPHRKCGTAFCIGGHLVRANGNEKVGSYVRWERSSALVPLFYPGHTRTLDNGHVYESEDESPGWECDAVQAARAVVNFLTLGDPRWDDVMRGA